MSRRTHKSDFEKPDEENTNHNAFKTQEQPWHIRAVNVALEHDRGKRLAVHEEDPKKPWYIAHV